MSNKEKLSKIKMFIMDVDGTLTDGKIYYGSEGEVFKAFNVKDGYRIVHLEQYGIIPVIITGRTSDIVTQRAADLKIKEVYQGVPDKISVYSMLKTKFSLGDDEIAYIGDDINDLECISLCGFTACPSDAVKDVKNAVDYVCSYKGGEGAVREVLDMLISTR